MSPDILAQLHAADPCPDARYDDSVAQRNIDAIVRTDLTVRSGVPVGRRRRRGWLAVAAVAVVVAVAGSVVGVEITRDRTPVVPAVPVETWVTFSSNGVSFEHPSAWTSYEFDEAPATVASVVTYLSTKPVSYTCTTTDGTTSCHTPSPSLLDGGVFVTWVDTFIPGQKIPTDGADATIAGRPAKLVRGDLRGCPMGAVGAVTATIAEDDPDVLGFIPNLLHMEACFGSGEDVTADLASVDRMLASLQLER